MTHAMPFRGVASRPFPGRVPGEAGFFGSFGELTRAHRFGCSRGSVLKLEGDGLLFGCNFVISAGLARSKFTADGPQADRRYLVAR